MATLLTGVFLVFALSCYARAVVTVSRTLDIDGHAFYIPQEPLAHFSGALDSGEILPLTVISTNVSSVSSDDIKQVIESWESIDDVFSRSFLQGESDSAYSILFLTFSLLSSYTDSSRKYR